MLHIVLLFIIFLIYYVANFYRRVRSFPPGPFPLPIIGNLHQLDLMKIHEEYTKLAEKYGPILTVWLPQPHIVLTDYETIKETLSRNDDCAGRSGVFPDTAFQLLPDSGIIFSEGLNWKEQRRTSLHILRDFGMGKNIMEHMVVSSAEECINHLHSLNGEKGLDLRWPLQLFVGNIITEVLFGWRYKYNDCQEFVEFAEVVERLFNEVKILDIPVVRDLLIGKCMGVTEKEFEMIRRNVGRCGKDYDTGHEPECFVQAYIQRLGSTGYHNEEQLLHVCADFYAAGMETTATTLRWCILYLAQYQVVQDKMRKEIEEAVGHGRLPSMGDKTRMPYTSAVIMEVQRISNLAPIGVQHKTMSSMDIGGHRIPKDTVVVPLLYNVLLNSSVYQKGHEFCPERFFLEDGVTPNKEAVEKCIPFGIGKRVCAGEGLARVELFIGLVAIVRDFKILPVPGVEIDFTPHVSIVLSPKDQDVRLLPIKK